jgi:ankyrin repeat protein
MKNQDPQVCLSRGRHGETGLHAASEAGHADIVKILLSLCDINAKDDVMRTPLHLAIERRRLDVVKLILSRPDLDINAVDASSATPLMSLVLTTIETNVDSSKEYLEELLKAKADPFIANSRGKYPLVVAIERGHWLFVDIFICYEAVAKPTESIATPSYPPKIRTPLHAACEMDSVFVVTQLTRMCPSSISAYDADGFQPIHVACQIGSVSIINILIKSGADPRFMVVIFSLTFLKFLSQFNFVQSFDPTPCGLQLELGIS